MGAYYQADFSVQRNADWVDAFRLELNGSPIDLTSALLTFTAVNVDGQSPDMVLTSAPGGGINILNAPNGTFEINRPAGTLPPRKSRWRHELIMTSGDATVLVWRGGLLIQEGVAGI